MKKYLLFFAFLTAVQSWAQNDIEVVNIENRAVRDYMEDAKTIYSNNNNYAVSIVAKYNDINKYGKKRLRGDCPWMAPRSLTENHHAAVHEEWQV